MAEDELYYYEQLQAAGYGPNGIPAQYAAEMEAMQGLNPQQRAA